MEPTPQPQAEGRALTPVAAIAAGLEKMRPQFKVSLPSHISPERFERTVLTALNNDPDLVSADRRSLFNSCAKAAQDGLLPDKREGALVIFKDKSGKKLVTWMPMVFGLVKKMRQSDEIDTIGANIVYQAEIDAKRFRYFIGEGREQLEHEPMLWGERGEKVLVYAYVRFKNGHVEYLPMHRDDVLKRKKASRSKDKDGKPTGPWRDWEEEMWRKTAIRAIAKRMPLSAEIMRTVGRNDDSEEFDRLKDDAVQSITAAAEAFGAPQIEDQTEDAEITEDESPLDRGKRLLTLCKNADDVAELQVSIAEELDDPEALEWAGACEARRGLISQL
jgi:recombination protein RecT